MLWIASAPRVKTASAGRRSAVVVSPMPLFSRTLVKVLEESDVDLDITVFTRSDAALEHIAANPTDLVLCEVAAVPVHGDEVARQLAATQPETRVILLLDEPRCADLAAALRTGAAGVFTKQSDAEAVVAGICAVLEGDRSVSSDLVEDVLHILESPAGNGAAGPLSDAEAAVLALLSESRPDESIAALLGVTRAEAAQLRRNAFRKLDVSSRSQAVVMATRLGLIDTGAHAL